MWDPDRRIAYSYSQYANFAQLLTVSPRGGALAWSPAALAAIASYSKTLHVFRMHNVKEQEDSNIDKF